MIGHRLAFWSTWGATAAAAVAVGLAVPRTALLQALAVELSLAVVVAFGLQLVIGEPTGMIQRLAVTTSGCFLLVVAAAIGFGIRG